ncbi:MAG TPA: 3-methylaspartate ammonia-lyase, partial [Desulfobacteria bacterium]|nr:3-methylaspartate ammonia-lyase [Desulfobacteria bacterium]
MKEVRVLSPTAILGYGFPEESFMAGLERKPDIIAADAGSTDPGPYYLGSGVSFTDREAVKRDLKYMLMAGREHGIPVLIGTAGGSGAEPHLVWTKDIVMEIAREENLSFRMAVIHGEINKEDVLTEFRKGRVAELPPGKPLTEDDIGDSTHIVGQMGVEPF